MRFVSARQSVFSVVVFLPAVIIQDWPDDEGQYERYGLMFLLYTWWAVSRSEAGYDWSVPERLGLMATAAAALIVSVRLALPTLSGASPRRDFPFP